MEKIHVVYTGYRGATFPDQHVEKIDENKVRETIVVEVIEPFFNVIMSNEDESEIDYDVEWAWEALEIMVGATAKLKGIKYARFEEVY